MRVPTQVGEGAFDDLVEGLGDDVQGNPRQEGGHLVRKPAWRYLGSTRTRSSRRHSVRIARSTYSTPSRSGMTAGWTFTPLSVPLVSATRCRLRLLTQDLPERRKPVR